MTLTKFMARSTWVAHAFEWEKLLKCHLKGKTSEKLAYGQNIDYSEKRKRPKGFICPCTGVKYHNIQTCLLVYAADSGECLQDHWSSGLKHLQKNKIIWTFWIGKPKKYGTKILTISRKRISYFAMKMMFFFYINEHLIVACIHFRSLVTSKTVIWEKSFWTVKLTILGKN